MEGRSAQLGQRELDRVLESKGGEKIGDENRVENVLHGLPRAES
jgi:hypothetical protein